MPTFQKLYQNLSCFSFIYFPKNVIEQTDTPIHPSSLELVTIVNKETKMSLDLTRNAMAHDCNGLSMLPISRSKGKIPVCKTKHAGLSQNQTDSVRD